MSSLGYPVPGPFVVAHRGGAGIAPENTATAFERSRALGLTHLELDLQQTSDGVLVAFHDASTRRVTGRSGTIRGRTWAQVQRLRIFGEHRVPRLDELLEALPDSRFMIDVKDGAALGGLVRLVRRARAVHRICLTGTYDAPLGDARALLGPGLVTAMGWESMGRLVLAAHTGRRPRGVVAARYVHVPLRWGYLQVLTNPVLTRRMVGLAADFGSEVVVWTVDDPAVAARLFGQGVAGVITDRPDVLTRPPVAVSRPPAQSSTTTATGPACPTVILPTPAAAFSGT